MKPILFLDTETTGKADFNRRASDPGQPHLVQVAAVFDNGEKFTAIVKPDGWTIPAEASAIHGITNEIAVREGEDEKLVAGILLVAVRSSSLLVSHNVTFDKFIVRIALRRYGLFTDADDAWWKSLPTFCTMRQMTEVCKLPNQYGYHDYKWPSLQEAHRHAFGSEFDGAHGALADVQACERIYRWLEKRGANVPCS